MTRQPMATGVSRRVDMIDILRPNETVVDRSFQRPGLQTNARAHPPPWLYHGEGLAQVQIAS